LLLLLLLPLLPRFFSHSCRNANLILLLLLLPLLLPPPVDVGTPKGWIGPVIPDRFYREKRGA